MAAHAAFQMPPEAVTTIVTKQEVWPATIGAIGSVAPVRGVTVSADLSGLVEQINFESGKTVKEGEVLVQLDTHQEQAQLAAAEAQRDLAQVNVKRFRDLNEKGVAAPAEFDRADAEAKQADARIGEIKAVIARKTIRAPFSGILGIRQVNLGQYLAGGAAIVSLQSIDPVYVDFSVPQQQVGKLHAGTEVFVTAEGGPEVAGRVSAVDSIANEATRNVQVRATLANPNGRLRAGMFVQVRAVLGGGDTVVSLPATSVSYAPYGDSVFVVESLKNQKGETYKGVSQRFVKLGMGRGDQIAVVSGLKPGEEVVTSGVFKLRNGAAVQVNNTKQPPNNPAPKPQES
jgi:membrane fusion protein (multidrug efflux system)